MRRWVKKIHMYVGLLSFSALLVYGIAGLTATFSAPVSGPRFPALVEDVPFQAPTQASDREVADAVYRRLQPPLATPVPPYALERDRDNNLSLEFWTVNGTRHVTVLEKENRLRVEVRRNDVWRYLDSLHSATEASPDRDLRLRLWAWYNQFSILALLWLAISGLYLWLSTRPWFRWAQWSFGAGLAIFIVLYVLTR